MKQFSIDQLVLEAEQVSLLSGPRLPGNRRGTCLYWSEIVRIIGQENGMDARQYQAFRIPRGIPKNSSAQHCFNVVDNNLLDLSYVQFIIPGRKFVSPFGQSGKIYGEKMEKYSPISIKNYVIKNLINKGYVPLTEHNLNIYLQSLSTELIDPIGVDIFDLVLEEENEFSKEYFSKSFRRANLLKYC